MSSGMRSRMSSTMSSGLALVAPTARSPHRRLRSSSDRVNRYGFIAGDAGGCSTGCSVSERGSAIHLSACSASSNHARAILRRVSLFFMSAVFAAISVQCAACSL